MPQATPPLARIALALLTLGLVACASDHVPAPEPEPTPSLTLAERSRAKRFDASYGTVVALQTPIALSLGNLPDTAKLCSSSANVTFTRDGETGTATFGTPEKDVAVWAAPKGDCADAAAALGRFVVTVEGAELYAFDTVKHYSNVYDYVAPYRFTSRGDKLYYLDISDAGSGGSFPAFHELDLQTGKDRHISSVKWRGGSGLAYAFDPSGLPSVLQWPYIGSETFNYHRLDAHWTPQTPSVKVATKDTGYETIGQPLIYARADGTVLIAAPETRTLSAFSPTGSRLWAKTLASVPLSLTGDKDNNVYVGLDDASVIAYDPSGQERWVSRDSASPVKLTSFTLSVAGGYLYTDHRPRSINLSTGEELRVSDGTFRFEKAAGDRVFLRRSDQSSSPLYAFVFEGGQISSRLSNPEGRIPADLSPDDLDFSAAGNVYFVSEDRLSLQKVTVGADGQPEQRTLLKLDHCERPNADPAGITAVHLLEDGKLAYSGCRFNPTEIFTGRDMTNRFRIIATLN